MRMIDADSLKERMFAETPEHEKGVVDIFLEAVAAMIDEQPTIEERKTGKWLETDSHEPCWYKCDQCGRLYDLPDKYCPNCGADMRGDEHETD